MWQNGFRYLSLVLILTAIGAPPAVAAPTTLDGPVIVEGGWPDILIGDGLELQSVSDAVLWQKRSFHLLLDSDNNQGSATFKIYEDVTSSSGATPGIQLGVGGGKSWLSLGGNLGVGTTNPQSKLAVNGTVTAKEVVVTQTGWPDFVFEDGYELMPLDELEREIQTAGHLPGIPSAAEAAEGVGLGDVQARLLRKIEELTLYVIELKKENAELGTRVRALEGTR